MHADDKVLIRDSRKNLRVLLEEFDIVCMRRKLKANASKSKAKGSAKTERRELEWSDARRG